VALRPAEIVSLGGIRVVSPVTELEGTEIHENNGGNAERLGNEVDYRKAETLGDAEDAPGWWQDNLV